MFPRSNRISSMDDEINPTPPLYYLETEDQEQKSKQVQQWVEGEFQQNKKTNGNFKPDARVQKNLESVGNSMCCQNNSHQGSTKQIVETFDSTHQESATPSINLPSNQPLNGYAAHDRVEDASRNLKPFSGDIGSSHYNTDEASCSRKKSLVETNYSPNINLWKRKRSSEEANRFAEVPKAQKQAGVPVDLKQSNAVGLSLDEIIKKNNIQYNRSSNERPPDRYETVPEKLDNGESIRYKQQEPVTQVPRQQLPDIIPICSEEKKTGQLRPIVIDGSNVAAEYGSKHRMDCKGIQVCVNYFIQEGHKDITVVVPESYLEAGNSRIVNKDVLHGLQEKGHLMTCWSRQESKRKWVNSYDDRMILELAHRKEGGVIVSNDKYRDLYKEHPNWRVTIFSKLLPFRFIPGKPDEIMLPQDPLGRYGPTLQEFLRYD